MFERTDQPATGTSTMQHLQKAVEHLQEARKRILTPLAKCQLFFLETQMEAIIQLQAEEAKEAKLRVAEDVSSKTYVGRVFLFPRLEGLTIVKYAECSQAFSSVVRCLQNLVDRYFCSDIYDDRYVMVAYIDQAENLSNKIDNSSNKIARVFEFSRPNCIKAKQGDIIEMCEIPAEGWPRQENWTNFISHLVQRPCLATTNQCICVVAEV